MKRAGAALSQLSRGGWTDPAFAKVAQVVHLVSGLVFPLNRQPAAESGMRRAMSALRIPDPHSLSRAVEVAGEARDTVLAELTVGETYFFRDAGQLDVIGTHVLPGLREKRGALSPLRVWSAGCASGEEAYTIAIMLRELRWPHAARILGTDIARPRLEAARRGRYTRWSLRGVTQARTDRWFQKRGSHFQLDAAIRDSAQFATLNLVADGYPTDATGTTNQDIVLCRNVLIYFDMTSVALIATRLLDALAPDGWLLLGASDPPLSGLVPCEVVMTPAGVCYRRADRDPERAMPGRLATAVASDWWNARPPAAEVAMPPMPRDVPPIAIARASEVVIAAEVTAMATPAEWIAVIRSLADKGQLREAEQQCVLALDAVRESTELHLLHATLLSAARQHREAAKAARRALYLDRRSVIGYLQLGDALAQLSEHVPASRAFQNVITELIGVEDSVKIPAADGISASRLRQIAQARLGALGMARQI